jgi:hypothetical protein
LKRNRTLHETEFASCLVATTKESFSDVGGSKKPKPTNNKKLTLKELRLEALSFSGHGDAAKMLQTGQEVDFELFEPKW